MAGRLQQARAEAVARGANVAVRFGAASAAIRFTTYADGNRNGVLSPDIAEGIDPEIGPATDLSAFTGAGFGVTEGMPSPEGPPITGSDPIRFGASRMVSFTSQGTATAGSLYIRGAGGSHYVVRVYGDTGKTRILRFDRRRAQWEPL